MDASPDIVADPADLPEDRARLDRQLARLDRLSDLGLEIAQALAAQAKGAGPVVVEGDLALAYDRVARAVRMAVMLQSRLVEEARAAETKAVDPAARRKDQIARIIGRVAERDERLDIPHMIAAKQEARERLEHDDIYGPVMEQPISDVVAEICRDFGLTPEWARLAREAWAVDEVADGEMGEPLRDLLADDEHDEEPAAGPAEDDPPSMPAFEERLQALARDPRSLAAARRDTG